MHNGTGDVPSEVLKYFILTSEITVSICVCVMCGRPMVRPLLLVYICLSCFSHYTLSASQLRN